MSKVIGKFAKGIKSEYAGKKIYHLSDDVYALDTGERLTTEVLRDFYHQGFIVPDDATESELSSGGIGVVIPEQIDLKDPESPIKPVGEILCRVSPVVDYPFAGDLLFKTNIDNYLVSEHGHIIDMDTAKILSNQGYLLRNDLVFAPKGSMSTVVQKEPESSLSIAIRRRIIPVSISIILIVADAKIK